jgi:transcriptional regulator with XRE-family HTH domain
LEIARQRAGLTLQQIADRLHVRRASVWRWIHGVRRKTNPPLPLLQVLGVAELDARQRTWAGPRVTVGLPEGMDAQEAERVCVAALAEVRGK